MKQATRSTTILGWTATAMAAVLYVTYLDQIFLNLAGQKGSWIMPLATVINCGLWIAYGALRPKRDWPMLVANLPGVLLGTVTLITAL